MRQPMALLGEDQLRTMAFRAIEASTADETEIVMSADVESVTRFANSAIHQNVSEAGVEIRVRAVLGTRTGVAITNQWSEAEIGEAVRRAAESARMAPPDPAFPGLPDPAPIEPIITFSEATAGSTPEERALTVKAVCDQAVAAGLEASGLLSTRASELAVANSGALWAYHAYTAASFKTVVMSANSSGYAERSATDATKIEVGAAGQEAIQKALRSRDPSPLEPGEYPVVLEPYAVGTMLDYLAYMGLGAMALQEGRSFLNRGQRAGVAPTPPPTVGGGGLNTRIGERIVGENVSLWDDGLDPAGRPMPFDFEGVPKQRVDLIERGVARGVVYDSYTAARAGRTSTGHGLPAPNRQGPLPLHLFMARGAADESELLRGIRRGVWVTRFHYVNPVHPTQTIITGMTRDGTFLIEDGQITRPIQNLRFTQSILDALSCVEAIGGDWSVVQDDLGATCAPALRIARFRFSSATSF